MKAFKLIFSILALVFFFGAIFEGKVHGIITCVVLLVFVFILSKIEDKRVNNQKK